MVPVPFKNIRDSRVNRLFDRYFGKKTNHIKRDEKCIRGIILERKKKI